VPFDGLALRWILTVTFGIEVSMEMGKLRVKRKT
jgi:hypothetical protein